jgi:DeoR/GlpR family transcriptional regulator of sugar metabolism
MSVSEATVRRDLRQLADAKQVDLVYGGATIRRSPDQSIESRAQQNIEAKRQIGRLAAELVSDNEMLFVDGGTTCFEMRHYLLRKHGLSVIVNSTRLAIELGQKSDFSVILLGGHYRPDRMESIGPLTANAIDQLRGYIAFIGADGLDMEFGLSASDIQTAYLYQHVMKNARETILLVDHSKFHSPSLFRICDLDNVSRVVTDSAPSPEWIDCLASRGIDLIYPQPSKENSHA